MQARSRVADRFGGLGLFLASALALMLAGCKPGCTKSEPRGVRVGIVLPLTGENATYGVDCRRGIELALSQRNPSAEPPVQLFVEDSKAEPKAAIGAFQKLQNIDKVDAVIGDMFSATTLAIAPIAQRAGITLLTPTASARGIPAAGDHVFSIYPPPDAEGKAMAARLDASLRTRVVTIRQNLEVFNAIEGGFRQAIAQAGGTVVAAEILPNEMSEYRNLAARVAEQKPTAIYVSGYKNEAARIVIACREAAFTGPFFSQSTLLDDQVAQEFGQQLEGITFTGPAFSPKSNDPTIVAFREAYQRAHAGPPTVWAAYCYDAFQMLDRAIVAAKGDRLAIHRGLAGMTYQGLTGGTTILPDRTPEKTMVFYTIRARVIEQLPAQPK